MYGYRRNRDLHSGQNLPGRKRKQRDTPRPATATVPTLVLIPLGLFTVLIDIILVFAPWAAEGRIGPAAQKHLLTMLAQAQRLVIVYQHKAEHHLDAQLQGVKIPVKMASLSSLKLITPLPAGFSCGQFLFFARSYEYNLSIFNFRYSYRETSILAFRFLHCGHPLPRSKSCGRISQQ